MNKTHVVYKTSIPMFPIFLVLLFLKVFGIANISWFWVFFPLLFWIFAFLGFFILLFVFAILAIILAAIFS